MGSLWGTDAGERRPELREGEGSWALESSMGMGSGRPRGEPCRRSLRPPGPDGSQFSRVALQGGTTKGSWATETPAEWTTPSLWKRSAVKRSSWPPAAETTLWP